MFPRRHPELAELRKQMSRMPAAGPELRQLAQRARALLRELAETAGDLTSCRGCAKGRELPHARYEGGYCCGGNTFAVFCSYEVSALAAAGVPRRKLQAPHKEHAGCVFRGPRGCSLAVEHRPIICVEYFCEEATRELDRAGRLAEVDALREEMRAAFAVFKREYTEQELDRLLNGH